MLPLPFFIYGSVEMRRAPATEVQPRLVGTMILIYSGYLFIYAH